jgi:hypothetical protein
MAPVAPPASPPASSAAASPIKIDTANSSMKFGVLAQPQFESAGASVGDGRSLNLYMRRVRILLAGSLFGSIEYFMETDSSNLFKAGADGNRTTSAMVIQDAFATFKVWKDMIKVDVGYTLPPLARNALQSAASLYALDYFANSFLHANSFGNAVNPVGRDLGVQLRGLLLNGLVEYRLGAFQGRRNPAITTPAATAGGTPTVDRIAARNSFRVAGRLQINLLDPETGFFYAGTYLGAKRILSLGGAYDYQRYEPGSYKYWAADGFLDLPVGPGAVTAQVDFAHWDGGELVSLSRRYAVMSEAGYRIADLRLSPIVRFERLWVPGKNGAADITETRVGGGLSLWAYGHNSNVKVFYARVIPSATGQNSYNVFTLQWQVFVF